MNFEIRINNSVNKGIYNEISFLLVIIDYFEGDLSGVGERVGE